MDFRRALMVGLVIWLLATMLTGCRASAARSDRVETEWSRGANLGQAALNNPASMTITAQGHEVSLAWVREDRPNGQQRLHLVRVDRSGQVLLDRDLELETTRPEQVQIEQDNDGVFHLFWLDGPRDERQLRHIRADSTGALIASTAVLSLPGASVSSYALDQDNQGQFHILWAAREGRNPGLYHTSIAADGQIAAQSLVLSDQGFEPAMRIDSDGRLHTVWYEEPRFNEYLLYYAIYDPARGALGPVTSLAAFPTGIGLTAHRPELGLTTTAAYVFWSLERRGGGRTEPMAESYWLTFPLGQADQVTRPRQVNVPSLNHPEHNASVGAFHTGRWAAPMEDALPATFVYFPSASRGQRETLPVAFAVQLEGRTTSTIQIVLTLWAAGDMQGYQIAARTNSTSLRPTLLADEGDHLYLSWVDTAGFGRYDVFYASSAPEARVNLNRLTISDIIAAVMGVVWGVAQAFSFIPITFIWAFLPLLVVSIYAFARAEDDMARQGPRIALVVAIILYAAVKYLFRPNWLAALPLPRDTPDGLATVIIFIAPMLISLLASVATWFYVKRRETASLFPTLAVFVGTDILLTLLIYVPSILAE